MASSGDASSFESLSCSSSFVDWEAEELAATAAEEAAAQALRGRGRNAITERKRMPRTEGKHFTRGDSDDDSDATGDAFHRLAMGFSTDAAAAAATAPQPRRLGNVALVRTRATSVQVALERAQPRSQRPQVARLVEVGAPSPENSSASFAPMGQPSDPSYPSPSRASSDVSYDEMLMPPLPATACTRHRPTAPPPSPPHPRATATAVATPIRPTAHSTLPARQDVAASATNTTTSVASNAAAVGPARDPFAETLQPRDDRLLPRDHSSNERGARHSHTRTHGSGGSGSGSGRGDVEDGESASTSPQPSAMTAQPQRTAAVPAPASLPFPRGFLNTNLTAESSEEEEGEAAATASAAAATARPAVLSSIPLRCSVPFPWAELQHRWGALPPLTRTGAASLALLLVVLPVNLMIVDVLLYKRIVAAVGQGSASSSSPPHQQSHTHRPRTHNSISLLAAKILWLMFPHGALFRLYKSDCWRTLKAKLQEAAEEGTEPARPSAAPTRDSALSTEWERHRAASHGGRAVCDKAGSVLEHEADTYEAVLAELNKVWLGTCEALALFLHWVWEHLLDHDVVDPYLQLLQWSLQEAVSASVVSAATHVLRDRRPYQTAVAAPVS